MLIRWWDAPPVVLLVPSWEPICIRKTKSSGRLDCRIPLGAVRGLPLTQERRRFLVKQGMNPELIKRGYVFDVSDTLAAQFDRDTNATISLAEKCGLTLDDLAKFHEASKKLASFNPTNRAERLAKQALETLFSSKAGAKGAGRPKRISAEERQQMRERAGKMQAAGQNRRDIVAQFSEEYDLRRSYIRRILEDRRKKEL